ncbi:tyrosine-type recombinase/integrase [Halorarum salinum]|uniref:tyrosine-type recombinase/integrase n=1 Tax=Halorarum salinum TaxID=2743089 RepID=UPI001C533AF9|nr:site-specific integrase [Halobaculum salinum]
MNRSPPSDLTITEAIELYIHRKSPDWKGETERTYRRNLRVFEDYAAENDLETIEDLTRWTIGGFTDYLLEQDFARVTVASRQKTAKTWLKYLESQGVLDLGLHLAIDTIKTTDEEESSDQQLAPSDARDLLAFYRNSTAWRGTRRHAMLEIFWHVGCRSSAVRGLDIDDYEDGVLKFRNRPDTGTRLKSGNEHERNVVLSEKPRKVLELFIARERINKRDEHGRAPLFTSRRGRPTLNTIRSWMYLTTQPCMAVECRTATGGRTANTFPVTKLASARRRVVRMRFATGRSRGSGISASTRIPSLRGWRRLRRSSGGTTTTPTSTTSSNAVVRRPR